MRRQFALVTLAVGSWFTMLGCSSDPEASSDGVYVELLGGLPYDSAEDIVTYGDFAGTFVVESERDFTSSDITPRFDGAPATLPAEDESDEDGFVGRVVNVSLDDVVWQRDDAEVPDSFEFVDLGWNNRSGTRIPVIPPSGVRLEVGREYFAVFAIWTDGPSPMNPWAVYYMSDAGTLVNSPLDPESPDDESDPLVGATPAAVGSILNTAEVPDYAKPFSGLDAAARAIGIQAELTPAADETEPSGSTP